MKTSIPTALVAIIAAAMVVTTFSTSLLAKEKAAVVNAPKAKDTKDTIVMNPKRTVEIIGEVNMRIIEKAKQVNKLSKESKEDIFLLINSPGGSVAAGNVFIASMKMAKIRGVTIKCVIPIYAASMAFSIMLNCNKNYVLEKTSLLFHPVRIQGRGEITSIQAQELASRLQKLDDELLIQLSNTLVTPRQDLIKPFIDEKWWSAKEMKAFIGNKFFLTIIRNIEGSDKIFNLKPSKQSKKKKTRIKDAIIYIAPSSPPELALPLFVEEIK